MTKIVVFISYVKYNDEETRFEIASKQSSIFNFKAIISSIIIRDFSIVKIKNKTTLTKLEKNEITLCVRIN